MNNKDFADWVSLDTTKPIWPHFYTVAPLVIIGTKEFDHYDLAPKHMAMPIGHGNYFGFVCTPKHATYHNIKREEEFAVSFPKADQLVYASLAASPRQCDTDEHKPIIESLPTQKANSIDAPLIQDSYLFLECRLDRIIDGFDEYSIITGCIVDAYVHKNAYRISDGDDEKMIAEMPMLAYLAYDRFAEVSDTKSFPYPRGFSMDFSDSKK
ncbi:MAG: flavin reductase family protein [Saprospiraceae bacterium]|nr:flavin reductase family protein [Saprospiraceae bacterium]